METKLTKNGRAFQRLTAERDALQARVAKLEAALTQCDRQIDVLMTWASADMPPLTAVCARDTQFKARAALRGTP